MYCSKLQSICPLAIGPQECAELRAAPTEKLNFKAVSGKQ
jgi:hypothetical protein